MKYRVMINSKSFPKNPHRSYRILKKPEIQNNPCESSQILKTCSQVLKKSRIS